MSEKNVRERIDPTKEVSLDNLRVGVVIADDIGLMAVRTREGWLTSDGQAATSEEMEWRLAGYGGICPLTIVNGAGRSGHIVRRFITGTPQGRDEKSVVWERLIAFRNEVIVRGFRKQLAVISSRETRKEFLDDLIYSVRRIRDVDEVRAQIARKLPLFPQPDDELPEWATYAHPWRWEAVEGFWERSADWKASWPEGGGVVVSATQKCARPGEIATTDVLAWLDARDDSVMSPADAVQVGEWFVEASRVMERITLDTDPTDDAKEVAA